MLPTLPFPPLLLFFSSCIARRFTLRMLLTPYKCTFTQIHIFTRNFPKRRESWPTSCYGKHFQTRINQYKTFKTFSRRFNSARNPAKKKVLSPAKPVCNAKPRFPQRANPRSACFSNPSARLTSTARQPSLASPKPSTAFVACETSCTRSALSYIVCQFGLPHSST